MQHLSSQLQRHHSLGRDTSCCEQSTLCSRVAESLLGLFFTGARCYVDVLLMKTLL